VEAVAAGAGENHVLGQEEEDEQEHGEGGDEEEGPKMMGPNNCVGGASESNLRTKKSRKKKAKRKWMEIGNKGKKMIVWSLSGFVSLSCLKSRLPLPPSLASG
jgi:hypothetical protein